MTAQYLDLGIVVLILLSAVIGLIRGFVKEALSLVTWVAAAGLAFLYEARFANQLPFVVQSEVVRRVIAFAVIFFCILVIGAILNHLISTAISSIGLGGLDHVLGGAFGVLRGGLIITLLVLLMGLTPYPKQAWWKDSIFMPWFENSAQLVRQMIPQHFASYLEREQDVLPPP